MHERLTKFLGVEPDETTRVALLLTISFFMGLFLATVSVAAQTEFLNLEGIIEKEELPKALFIGGGLGFIASGLFNILVGRISFRFLSIFFLLLTIGGTAFLEFGQAYVPEKTLFQLGFSLVLPFTFVVQLVFWGSFNRMFTLRQQKRVIGSVDGGMDIAQILAFFTIPVMLNFGVELRTLFTIGMFSLVAFLLLFIVLSGKYLTHAAMEAAVGLLNEKENKKLNLIQFFGTKYIFLLSAFIILSFAALRFIDYSFLMVSSTTFSNEGLPVFLSLFEATIVIFSYLFATFAADRIQEEYGLRVSLLLNPLLALIFTASALALGFFFGYDPTQGPIIFFFIMVAMSKLIANSLRDALDTPVFKFYYVPIEKSIKLFQMNPSVSGAMAR